MPLIVGLLAQAAWLAVAPAEWQDDLAPLVAARAAEGYAARCVALEDALADPAGARGADAPERLKLFLYEQWRDARLTHVLLVGDAGAMPLRFMLLDRVTAPACNVAFYASDLYYADLARADGSFDSWNENRLAEHAAYFGEVRGEHDKSGPINADAVSYLPEIAVGRWPVGGRAEVRALVAKTIAWDAAQAAPTALLVHAGEWVDERPRLGARADELAAGGWTVQRQFFGTESEPTPERVLAALTAGASLVLHAGHGSADGWHLCLGSGHLARLGAAPPAIYFSAGCSTAALVHEPPYESYLDVAGIPHRGTNAGEVFAAPPPAPAPLQPQRFLHSSFGTAVLLLPAGGAVAYIGCVTGSQPAAMSLLDGFAQAAAGGASTVGAAWRDAVIHYHAAERLAELQPDAGWYPPSIFFQGMKFILYGDPACRMPRTAP